MNISSFYSFFDPRDLPLLHCPRPLLKSSSPTLRVQKALVELKKKECYHLFVENFQNAALMASLSCLMQWILYNGKPCSYQSGKPNEPAWFQRTSTVIARGNAGQTLKSEFLQERFPLVLKKALTRLNMTDTLHEYIIGIYALNELRVINPNFVYTMGLYYSPPSNKLILEHIDGESYYENINRVNSLPCEERNAEYFLKTFIQIVLALEQAQESNLFTHYDLHSKNIVCRRVDKSLGKIEYQIYNKIYILENLVTIPTIIDFGHASCAIKEKGKIGFIGKSGQNSFPQFGMLPSFIPGADLFKLLFDIQLSLYPQDKNFDRNRMGRRLSNFFRFIFQEIYEIQIYDPSQPNYKDPMHIKNSFANGTPFPSIYRSPYTVLEFIEKNRERILPLLGMTELPWKIQYSLGVKTYPNKGPKHQALSGCFEKMFCSPIGNDIKKGLFSVSWRTENLSTTCPVSWQKIMTNKRGINALPLLRPLDLQKIENFLSPHQDWLDYIQDMDSLTTMIRSGRLPEKRVLDFFDKYGERMIYFYRLYQCFFSYASYLRHDFKIPIRLT